MECAANPVQSSFVPEEKISSGEEKCSSADRIEAPFPSKRRSLREVRDKIKLKQAQQNTSSDSAAQKKYSAPLQPESRKSRRKTRQTTNSKKETDDKLDCDFKKYSDSQICDTTQQSSQTDAHGTKARHSLRQVRSRLKQKRSTAVSSDTPEFLSADSESPEGGSTPPVTVGTGSNAGKSKPQKVDELSESKRGQRLRPVVIEVELSSADEEPPGELTDRQLVR